MGYRRIIPWTKEEVAGIINDWPNMTTYAISQKYKRGCTTIRKFWEVIEGNKHGVEKSIELYGNFLKKYKRRYYTLEEKEKFIKSEKENRELTTDELESISSLWPYKTKKELAKIFKITEERVIRAGVEMGIDKSAEEINKNLNVLKVGSRYIFTESTTNGWFEQRTGRVIKDYGRFYLIQFDKNYKETMLKGTLTSGDIEFKEISEDFALAKNAFSVRKEEAVIKSVG